MHVLEALFEIFLFPLPLEVICSRPPPRVEGGDLAILKSDSFLIRVVSPSLFMVAFAWEDGNPGLGEYTAFLENVSRR